MTSEQPTYAQGAQGEAAPVANQKISFVTKLRYGFDNLISDTRNFILVVVLGTAVFANIVAALSYLNGDDPGQDPRWLNAISYDRRAWIAFAMLVLPVGKPDGTVFDRFLAVSLQIGTLIFTSLVIAFITAKILEITNRLKAGSSAVIDSNHTLILGWSNRVFPILKELAIATANQRKPVVVIFSSVARPDMEAEIARRVGDLGRIKLVTRTGDINNPADLKRANISAAKSIILLDAEKGADANIVSAVLAIKAASEKSGAKVIAEVEDALISSAVESATEGRVIAVRSDEVIARVTAQASRQPGLAAVVLDLLDFAGNEIYFKRVPALDNSSYSDALLAFASSSVIGYVTAEGEAHLNPSQSTKLAVGSKIILIAEDDSKIVYTGTRDDLAKTPVKASTALAAKPENMLIIGWSHMGVAVLNELAEFLPKGSSVHIVAQERYVAKDELKGLKFGSIKLTHAIIDGGIDELVAVAKAKKYDEIIVLGYRNKIAEGEADAHTMLTMLQLDTLIHQNAGANHTRLVAEILDSRKAELARVAANGDLVISDNLAALLIAQLGENPQLAPIFDDLFGPGGATIQLRPIEQYAALGKAVEFADLVVAARNFSESAIGYRSIARSTENGSTGSDLNPEKSTVYTPQAGDSLIVIGNI